MGTTVVTSEEEIEWPDHNCGIDIPHVHIVGFTEGRRNINIIALFGQFTSASNGWGDSIEVTFHSGEHSKQGQVVQ
jgi:hypothetical protein